MFRIDLDRPVTVCHLNCHLHEGRSRAIRHGWPLERERPGRGRAIQGSVLRTEHLDTFGALFFHIFFHFVCLFVLII